MKKIKKKNIKSLAQKQKACIHPLQAPAFQSDALARDFLRSPKTFAKKLGIPLESLACPPEAHAALKRGSKGPKCHTRSRVAKRVAEDRKHTIRSQL